MEYIRVRTDAVYRQCCTSVCHRPCSPRVVHQHKPHKSDMHATLDNAVGQQTMYLNDGVQHSVGQQKVYLLIVLAKRYTGPLPPAVDQRQSLPNGLQPGYGFTGVGPVCYTPWVGDCWSIINKLR